MCSSWEQKVRKSREIIRRVTESRHLIRGRNVYMDYMYVRMFGSKKLTVDGVELEYACLPPEDFPVRVHVLLLSHVVTVNHDTLESVKKELGAFAGEMAYRNAILRCPEGVVVLSDAFNRRISIDRVATSDIEGFLRKLVRVLLRNGWLKEDRIMPFEEAVRRTEQLERILRGEF